MAEENGMTIRDAALALGVSQQQVYKLVWDRKLSGKKIDGQWRVSAKAVAARLNSRAK